MKSRLLSLSIFLFLASCDDDPKITPETIYYRNLGDVRAGYLNPFSLDIDNDGESEFRFSTSLIADHIGDHLHFRVTAAKNNNLIEASGQAAQLNEGEDITSSKPFNKYVESMVIKTIAGNQTISWSGDWKTAQEKFIGIRFSLKNKSYYYGWVRLSFDQENEEFILHDFAYREALNKEIKSGEIGN